MNYKQKSTLKYFLLFDIMIYVSEEAVLLTEYIRLKVAFYGDKRQNIRIAEQMEDL